jgi:GNAT superfamily N-acetyltransferase
MIAARDRTSAFDPRVVCVTPSDSETLAQVALLFVEYAEWLAPLGVRTTIAEEVTSLPAPFCAPSGVLLAGVAQSGAVCGCVGVKRHSDTAAEIKRLFVREECRGSGMGGALFSAALDAACDLGYSEALVSTIPSRMAPADAMYRHFGFRPTPCFEDFTRADAEIHYLRLELGGWCP